MLLRDVHLDKVHTNDLFRDVHLDSSHQGFVNIRRDFPACLFERFCGRFCGRVYPHWDWILTLTAGMRLFSAKRQKSVSFLCWIRYEVHIRLCSFQNTFDALPEFLFLLWLLPKKIIFTPVKFKSGFQMEPSWFLFGGAFVEKIINMRWIWTMNCILSCIISCLPQEESSLNGICSTQVHDGAYQSPFVWFVTTQRVVLTSIQISFWREMKNGEVCINQIDTKRSETEVKTRSLTLTPQNLACHCVPCDVCSTKDR